jgi:cardiolipin synthase
MAFSMNVVRKMKKAGVEVYSFNPRGFNVFKSTTNFRSHQKALIVDNKYALYGGSNIGDEYINANPKYNSLTDLNFIFKGEIVNSLNINFCLNILEFTSAKKETKNKLIKQLTHILKKEKGREKIQMQLSTSGPNYQLRPILFIMNQLFAMAKKKIRIVTPYFFPSNDLLISLIGVA